jgi:hypothetical protein
MNHFVSETFLETLSIQHIKRAGYNKETRVFVILFIPIVCLFF